MKIIDTTNNKIVVEFMANHSLCLDDAINLVGELIDVEDADLPNVIIDDEKYYWDDLLLMV